MLPQRWPTGWKQVPLYFRRLTLPMKHRDHDLLALVTALRRTLAVKQVRHSRRLLVDVAGGLSAGDFNESRSFPFVSNIFEGRRES